MIKKICRIIVLVQILSLTTLRADDPDPHFETKGYLITKDSWIFSPEKAKDIRNRLIDLDSALKNIESYKNSLQLEKEMQDIQDKKIKLLVDQNDQLSKSLAASQSVNNIERFVWLSLGIVISGIAVYGMSQIHK